MQTKLMIETLAPLRAVRAQRCQWYRFLCEHVPADHGDLLFHTGEVSASRWDHDEHYFCIRKYCTDTASQG